MYTKLPAFLFHIWFSKMFVRKTSKWFCNSQDKKNLRQLRGVEKEEAVTGLLSLGFTVFKRRFISFILNELSLKRLRKAFVSPWSSHSFIPLFWEYIPGLIMLRLHIRKFTEINSRVLFVYKVLRSELFKLNNFPLQNYERFLLWKRSKI